MARDIDNTLESEPPIAIVTGAGRGIGRALLDVLLQDGYTVVGVVRNPADVARLREIDPKRVLSICCDVSEPASEDNLRRFLNESVSKVDLLINNAGFGATKYGIEGLDYLELENLLAVHCYGPIRCVRASLSLMRKSARPVIVNMSSRFGSLELVASRTVPHDQATYAYRIGKAAMNMLTSCLAVELDGEGIRVIAVDPGKVKTRFGPKDADTEPSAAARAIFDLIKRRSETAVFLHASGERVPW